MHQTCQNTGTQQRQRILHVALTALANAGQRGRVLHTHVGDAEGLGRRHADGETFHGARRRFSLKEGLMLLNARLRRALGHDGVSQRPVAYGSSPPHMQRHGALA